MAKLTHVDSSGEARMVDVGAKRITRRTAVAEGRVLLGRRAYSALQQNRLAKGDAIGVARLAAIQAAKRTSDWLPLCHAVPLDSLSIEIELDDDERAAILTATAQARWRTGVEMEALVAVSAGTLAIYDMAKALDRGITIAGIRLLEKSGGRSGNWKRVRR